MADEHCCSSVTPDFAGSYDVGLHPAVRRMEQHVLGCRYGATSWTTRSQAEQIALTLKLDGNSKVLDVGGGAGWPSLFLASVSGCQVTIVDLPVNALGLAMQRALDDGLADNVDVVCGDGTRLPFPDNSFDYVVHADVLCCLPEKFELLRECRRVASPNAQMHFSVILPASALPEAAHREAVDNGPPFVDATEGYAPLLKKSGWSTVIRTDASDEYGQCMGRLVDYMEENSQDLNEAFGRDEYARVIEHRRTQHSLIDKGWLSREVFVVA